MFGPFFREVWPKEREFRHVSLTQHLIALAVGAGNNFPQHWSNYDRTSSRLIKTMEVFIP